MTALVDGDTGAVVERYVYDPYGAVTFLQGNQEGQTEWAPTVVEGYADGTASVVASEVLYAGYRYDPETALYQLRNRQYDPSTGRFLQRDPSGYNGTMNQYGYAGGNPVTASDPMGLAGWQSSMNLSTGQTTPRYVTDTGLGMQYTVVVPTPPSPLPAAATAPGILTQLKNAVAAEYMKENAWCGHFLDRLGYDLKETLCLVRDVFDSSDTSSMGGPNRAKAVLASYSKWAASFWPSNENLFKWQFESRFGLRPTPAEDMKRYLPPGLGDMVEGFTAGKPEAWADVIFAVVTTKGARAISAGVFAPARVVPGSGFGLKVVSAEEWNLAGQETTAFANKMLEMNPGMARQYLSEAKYAAGMNDAGVAAMNRGLAVENYVAELMAKSPRYSPYTLHIGGAYSLDFMMLQSPSWIISDVTTNLEESAHWGRWYGPHATYWTYDTPQTFTVFPPP